VADGERLVGISLRLELLRHEEVSRHLSQRLEHARVINPSRLDLFSDHPFSLFLLCGRVADGLLDGGMTFRSVSSLRAALKQERPQKS